MNTLAITSGLLGLAGGLHCAAMCGGVVSAFSVVRFGRPSLKSTLLFNLGRIATYSGAGALAGGLSGSAIAAARLLPLQTMLFVAANGLLILLGLYLAGRGRVVLALEGVGARLWRGARALGLRPPRATNPQGQLLAGAVWGFTPCGLVYSALALALVSGGALRGALVMAAFGLGTLPNLLGAGWLLARFGSNLRRPPVRTAAGIVVAGFGVLGLVRVPGLAEHIRAGLMCLG
jgi:sulfite exporter TauE/SafE